MRGKTYKSGAPAHDYLEPPYSLREEIRSIRLHRNRLPYYGLDYNVDRSGVYKYERFFRPVMGSQTIVEMLAGRTEPVAIDLMAHPATLSELLRKAKRPDGFGIAVQYGPVPLAEHDPNTNITLVTGDLAFSRTWREVRMALDKRRADLIIERSMAGIDNLPRHSAFYGAAMNRLWHMLKPDGGVMLIQGPVRAVVAQVGLGHTDDVIASWARLLFENNIDVSMSGACSHDFLVIKLERHPESPATLPMLDKTQLMPQISYEDAIGLFARARN
jgi:hypothetical protein